VSSSLAGQPFRPGKASTATDMDQFTKLNRTLIVNPR
jgi:hypothetical protein